MDRTHAYPPDLARCVVEHWPAGHSLWLDEASLGEVLSVAYHTSFTTEEARPAHFRLLLMPAPALPESGAPNQGVLRLAFESSRPFTTEELRRLSPSTPFETALIGVHLEDGKLCIWGVAHSGAAWLAPTWGGREIVPTWTRDPIVHVNAPGRIAVRSAGKLVAALERGALLTATQDVFESKWLRQLFQREREDVRAEHAALQRNSEVPTLVEPELIGRVAQQMLRRAIRLIRGAGHGGMLLVLDGDAASADGGDVPGLRLKYRFGRDEPTRRYRTLLFGILAHLSNRSDKQSVDWADFVADTSPDLVQLEHAVFELGRLMANLSAVDGALVLDKRFTLVGYGAEVSAELPAPARVWRAQDPEGERLEPRDVEDVGTRHRAAYRFVQCHPERVAVVVSHDGGVSFVTSRDSRVVFWEQSVGP